jgi:hypothetical protein
MCHRRFDTAHALEDMRKLKDNNATEYASAPCSLALAHYLHFFSSHHLQPLILFHLLLPTTLASEITTNFEKLGTFKLFKSMQ